MRGLGRLRVDWVTGLVGAVEAVRLVRIASLPEVGIVDNVPDDAFFYLQLARNFARLGRWTFDGVEPASGFHVLWGYLLAGLFWVCPGASLRTVFVVGGVVELVCLTVACWLVGRTAVRVFGRGALFGVALIFLSGISLSIGLALMESSLVVLFSAWLLEVVLVGGAWWLALGLGFLGMLGRSDFFVLPLGLVVWGVVASGVGAGVGESGRAFARYPTLRKGREGWGTHGLEGGLGSVDPTLASRGWGTQGLVGGLAALGGAVVAGVGLALHTRWISGNWVQASVGQKLWWARVQGFSVEPALNVIERFFFVATNAYFARHRVLEVSFLLSRAIPVVLLVGLGWAMWRRMSRAQVGVAAGLLVVVAGYVGFYRFNSADLQFWYVAPFEAPVALLCGAVMASLAGRVRMGAFVMAGLLCVDGIVLSFKPTYPFQRTYYQAGLLVRAHPEWRPVASWNCGVMGFFAGGGVVNLDGLVNDRILPYARTGTLARYVGERGIATIIDSNIMLEGQMARRGGDADGRLAGCLVGEDVFRGNRDNIDEDERLFVYRVKAGCLGLR